MVKIDSHRQKQIEIINRLEKQITNNKLPFSTVDPVDDYKNDRRLCLTSVHLPHKKLVEQITRTLITPLRHISSDHFYYPEDSLHLTVKNIRVINDPPHFNQQDINDVREVFEAVIPKSKKIKVCFYRLMLFPANLALIGTTTEEMDNIHLELDRKLRLAGVPDDKQYFNSRYFFCNMTLVRFRSEITDAYRKKISELNQKMKIVPYTINSVSLLTCNAVLKRLNIIKTWSLK